MGSHEHHITIEQEKLSFPAKAKTFAIICLVAGLILFGIGAATYHPHEAKHEEHKHGSAQKVENTMVASAEHGDAEKAHEAATTHADNAAHAEEHHNMPNDKFVDRVEYQQENQSLGRRLWANVLVVGYFFLIISLAALFFVAVQYIANAGWSAAIKRVPEAIYTFIPVAFIIVLIVMIFAKHDLWHWAHFEHIKEGQPGYDAILAGKSGFLNSNMFYAFPVVLVIIWVLMGRKLRSLSSGEDNAEKGNLFFFKKSIRWSAAFAVVYGFTISVIAWLIMMSIDAHWFSTIFGVYNFATGWVTSLTVICMFVIYLKKIGYLKIVSDEHIHDLGKFMFAFSIFWTYIWVSQYLLIWYAHLPEEVYYYQIRYENYKFNFLVNVVLNFLCPFLILMMRNAKRNKTVLTIAGAILILGHYHDVWLMVFPGIFGPGMHFGLIEIGLLLTLGGIFVYWVFAAMAKRGLIAVNHPYIEESANHDVGI